MLFQGQITSVNTYEIMSDSITLTGTLCGRPCTITVQCKGVAEILAGQYGFNKNTVTVQVGNGEDL